VHTPDSDERLPPPVTSAQQELPFDRLSPQRFERLCLALVRREGALEHVQQYGVSGQGQDGIDVYSRAPDGTYVAYQCKRWQTMRPSEIRKAVTVFLDGAWAGRCAQFVLCTSADLRRTELADAIEEQAERLRSRGIRLVVWDADHLSLLLKDAPDLVREFFGPEWEARFIPEPPNAPEVRALIVIKATDADGAERLLTYKNVLWDCLLLPSLNLHGRRLRDRDDPYALASLARWLGTDPRDARVEKVYRAGHIAPKWSYSRDRLTEYRFSYYGVDLGALDGECRRPAFRVGGLDFAWMRLADLGQAANADRNADVWTYMANGGAPLLARVPSSFVLRPA
jgi:hypothetical protein